MSRPGGEYATSIEYCVCFQNVGRDVLKLQISHLVSKELGLTHRRLSALWSDGQERYGGQKHSLNVPLRLEIIKVMAFLCFW